MGESLALEMINAFAVERAFISCDALSIETGITNATMFEVGVKTRIIQRSREVILMADHSKFDTVEPHAVATLSCITTILSDSALPSAIARRYQQAGCRLIMSDPHQECVNGHQANEQNPSGSLARIAKTALASVTRMTPIWRTAKKFCKPIIWHHLLRWQTGWRLALRMPQSATIMSMAVTVRPWLSLKVFLFSLIPSTRRSETIDCSGATMGNE